MFIFDYGKMEKIIRGMRILPCDRCQKDTSQDLTEIGFFVTALDYALLPYKKRYVLICRNCNGGQELTGEEFEKLRTVAEEEEKRSSFTHDYQKSKRERMKFCRNCGERIRKDAKFCNHCGSLVD
jgi:hypothetical protein